MPNYKETTITGNKYQRACRVMIENPINKTPTVSFIEEEITINSDDNITHKLVGSLNMTFDPNEVVEIINPTTNLPTGQKYPTAIAQLIIYSLYWKKARERDAKV